MSRKRLTNAQRWRVFDDADETCHLCGIVIQARSGDPWDVSHVIPLEAGGKDEPENMRPAHRACHRAHTATVDAPLIAKTKRMAQKAVGIRKPPSFRHPHLRRKLNGTVVERT